MLNMLRIIYYLLSIIAVVIKIIHIHRHKE